MREIYSKIITLKNAVGDLNIKIIYMRQINQKRLW